MVNIYWNIVSTAANKDRRWRKPRNHSLDALADAVDKSETDSIISDDIDIDIDALLDGAGDSTEEESTTPEPPEENNTEQDEQDVDDSTDKDEPNKEDESEESWIDSLTPYSPEPAAEQQEESGEQPSTEQLPSQPQETPAPQTDESINAAEELARIQQEKELEERLSTMETVEPDVAKELLEKLVNPAVESIRQTYSQENQKLHEELEQLRNKADTVVNQTTQQQRNAILARANKRITEVYPKAYDILNSVQFKEYLDANSNPYATEKKSDILKRAYASGDADYVINTLNDFKASIKKPKPAVSAESTGAAGTNKSSSGGVKITAEQYQKARAKLRAAPQTPENKRKLRVLSENYTKQLQGK